MKKIKLFFLLIIIILFYDNLFAQQIENNLYRITVPANFSNERKFIVCYKPTNLCRKISPKIHLLYSEKDPCFIESSINKFSVVGWKNINTEHNIFNLNGEVLTAENVEKTADNLIFKFNSTSSGNVKLEIILPQGSESPEFKMSINTNKSGWFSLGFVGITPEKPEHLDFLYQPLSWSWKRFPSEVCLTEESMATTAATFVNHNGFTEGITPSPEMISYYYALSRGWWANDRKDWMKEIGSRESFFGLALRNNSGEAQPMLYAPILGGFNSFMKEKSNYSFSCKYVLISGDWISGSEFILRKIFKYKKERENGAVTLNQTIDNMLNFAMNDKLSGWIEEYKGSDYSFDAPGTVKNVSPLHSLGIALSTGNMDILKKRALPMLEYAMSREKYLYAIDENQKEQNPSHLLKGPCIELGELAGLHEITNGQSTAFSKEMDRLFGKPRRLNLQTISVGNSWRDYLSRYRIYKNNDDLQKAIDGANNYITSNIEKYPTDFYSNEGLKDKQAAFQIDFTTNIFDLFELWEITHNKRYLEVSRIGARQLALWARSNPMAPDSVITINQGGSVNGIFPGRRYKVGSSDFDKRNMKTKLPEMKTPAWITSLVGLMPEQPSTYTYGPIMLTEYAPWFLRIAEATNDSLLADIAYNAVLGRYANFPGYYFTSLRTNVYGVEDYPMHSYYDIKYNAIFYNHVWPHLAMLFDFIVSDAYYRSKGKVDFPSVYSPGYAYLTSKVYGASEGRIFDNENMKLWIPPKALYSSSKAINYLLGVGKNATCIVLMNTSKKNEETQIQLNQDVVNYNSNQKYNIVIYDNDGNIQEGSMENGKFSISVPAGKLIALKIKQLVINVPLITNSQNYYKSISAKNYIRKETNNEFLGTLTAMMINIKPNFSDAYIFSDVTDRKVKSVTLHYSLGESHWKIMTDKRYPFEFSIHLKNPKDKLTFKWVARNYEGIIIESDEMIIYN